MLLTLASQIKATVLGMYVLNYIFGFRAFGQFSSNLPTFKFFKIILQRHVIFSRKLTS